MMCNLLILYARDSKDIKGDLMLKLRGIPTLTICVDDPKFSSHKALQNPIKSKLQLVFFSPDFLNFLECRPDEAYEIFKHMDPLSTVAIFCCGLYEHEIMCYHIAPLKSYTSWPKFAVGNIKENKIFPIQLLQRIKEIFPKEVSKTESIVIVPQIIHQDCSNVYIIFTNAVQDMTGLSVFLEGEHCVQITPDTINPFVAHFQIPECLIDSHDSLKVRVQELNKTLTEKSLRIHHDYPKREPATSTEAKPIDTELSQEAIILEEHLQFLSEFACTRDEDMEDELTREHTILPQEEEEVMRSLTALCKKYGLEELSLFIEEPETEMNDPILDVNENHNSDQRFFFLDECKPQNACPADSAFTNSERLQIPNEELDVHPICRSFSMPTILPESNNNYEEYLPMQAVRTPNYDFYPTREHKEISYSLSSNSYTYMKWKPDREDSLEMVRMHLSESQLELLEIMHAFKRGDMTLSNVEEQFQSWHRRHGEQSKSHVDHDKPQKSSSSFLPDWKSLIQRRPGRKNSKASDTDKRLSLSGIEKLNSSQRSSRKISSASASSASSKTSDGSSSTVHSRGNGGYIKEAVREVSTGWLPLYSTCRQCPLNPEIEAPPLPPKPPLVSKPSSDNIKEVKQQAYPKRKVSTPLPPIPLQETKETPIPDNELGQSNDYQASNRVRTLIHVCERYGLEDLGDYFVSEICSGSKVDTENPREDLTNVKGEENWDTTEDNVLNSKICIQEPVGEWDGDQYLSTLRRSLSLPSTLYATEATNTEENLNSKCTIEEKNVGIQENNRLSNFSLNDSMINSFTSNIYASVKSQIDCGQNPALLKSSLSNSQQELLELINAFKRGKKTMSQVEEQFQEWHQRHMGSSSLRERELSQLKSAYEKAKKPSIFGLPDIKNFILRKPKRKNSKCTESGKTIKQRNGKSESDIKRLSKISCTSTSSGISDSGEVFRNVCYFNRDYGQFCPEEYSESSTPLKRPFSPFENNPPPLPYRPLPASTSSMSSESSRNISNAPQLENHRSSQNPPPLPYRPPPASTSSTGPEPNRNINNASQLENYQNFHLDRNIQRSMKEKPLPPPKPSNILKKSFTFDTCIKNQEDEDKKSNEPEITPSSPDYVIPNQIRFFSAATNKQPRSQATKNNSHNKVTSSNSTSSSPTVRTYCKKTETITPVVHPIIKTTTPELKMSKIGSPSAKADIDRLKTVSQKRQLLKIPSPFAKPMVKEKKKKEESMFYIASRRWSSFPDLRTSQPIYIELIDAIERNIDSSSNG